MIVVTGATGFTGGHVAALIEDVPVRLMVRNPATVPDSLRRPGVELVVGDFGDRTSLVRAFAGCDTLLNVGSLGFGHGLDVVSAAEEAGIRRAVFVSTTAIFTNLEAKTKATRLAAEARIKSSRLDWTILRPTMIYGTERDRNIYRLLRSLNRFRVFPVFGDGERLQQPIHVQDLAKAIVTSSKRENTIRREYNLSGALPVTFNQLIHLAGKALGKRVHTLHIPQGLVLSLLGFYERVSRRPILKAEQVLRLNEDKAFPHDAAASDFGFTPRPFGDGVQEMVEDLRRRGLL